MTILNYLFVIMVFVLLGYILDKICEPSMKRNAKRAEEERIKKSKQESDEIYELIRKGVYKDYRDAIETCKAIEKERREILNSKILLTIFFVIAALMILKDMSRR